MTEASISDAPRALRACAALEGDPPCGADAGRLLRVLAAAKPRAVALQMGSGSAALSTWLLDGLDITSRLISLLGDPARVAPVRRVIGDDIRVAVHAQDALEFLHDVRRNRFDLVAIDQPDIDPRVAGAAFGLLAPGGTLCLVDPCAQGAPVAPAEAPAAHHLKTLADCRWSMLGTPLVGLLAVRISPGKEQKRRGGRKARHAAERPNVSHLSAL